VEVEQGAVGDPERGQRGRGGGRLVERGDGGGGRGGGGGEQGRVEGERGVFGGYARGLLDGAEEVGERGRVRDGDALEAVAVER